jgi:Cu(I)/Ag(I) efflux system protein CusF
MSGMKDMASTPAAKTGKATGVIKAIDPKGGTLTIQHGPIPGVGWPAMTMTFKATPPALLKGLKVGQTIGFDTTVRGMSAEVTAIRPK